MGTNGWYDTETGHTLSVLVNAAEYSIVLDAGSGFAGLDQYLPDDRPVYLFLSHLHLDHVIGLHSLPIHRIPAGLHIFGQPGTRGALGTLFDAPYSILLESSSFKVTVHDWPEGVGQLPFQVKALPLVHATPCFGYRIEIDGRVLAYTTDTGYCANAVELARGADLLIAECSLKPGEVNEGWPHLNPELAARIAAEAGASRLALVHFDPTNYPTLELRRKGEETARRVFPATSAGTDGMVIDL